MAYQKDKVQNISKETQAICHDPEVSKPCES
jgi:hypothetical protein